MEFLCCPHLLPPSQYCSLHTSSPSLSSPHYPPHYHLLHTTSPVTILTTTPATTALPTYIPTAPPAIVNYSQLFPPRLLLLSLFQITRPTHTCSPFTTTDHYPPPIPALHTTSPYFTQLLHPLLHTLPHLLLPLPHYLSVTNPSIRQSLSPNNSILLALYAPGGVSCSLHQESLLPSAPP